jgi:hypothetical protein
MAKVAPRAKKPSPPTRAKKTRTTPDPVVPGLVSFSYHDVAYEIDANRSKVYRRFIEIEKSRQLSILNAFRTTTRPML